MQDFDLEGMGHNSAAYIHTVTEALKLALADRDAHYGDPDFAKVPAATLLSAAYAAERRQLIDPAKASNLPRPGQPWRLERGSRPTSLLERTTAWGLHHDPQRRNVSTGPRNRGAHPTPRPINVADARGNLFSASPSSAWFFGGVFIAGDTGVPLGNRMQAFVIVGGASEHRGGRQEAAHDVDADGGAPGRQAVHRAARARAATARTSRRFRCLLNLAVFGMRPQEAIEAPRFNSLHYHESFGNHALPRRRAGARGSHRARRGRRAADASATRCRWSGRS